MVKIVHFADLHLGVENYGRPDAASGLHTRLLDFLRSFDEVVDYALAQLVDLVVFAGDAYKNREPNPTHQREFARRIHRLALAQIPVFLLTGNHDLPSTYGRANTLDIYTTLDVANVYVCHNPGSCTIATRSGLVQIVALPWIVRSHLFARELLRNQSLSEIEDLTIRELEKRLNEELARLDPKVPTILVAHQSVHGAVYGSERSVMLGQELVLPRSLLKNDAFDYVALGHIHRHQVLDHNPPMVYAGSVDRIDFGEEKEAKGFVVAEVEKGHSSFQFVELAHTRRFVTIEVVADGDEPMAQIQQAVVAHDIRDAIVRLIIHTTMEKNQLLHDKEINDLLSPAFKVAAVVRDIERVARLRLRSDQAVEKMTVLEVLDRYLQLRQMSKERVAKLMEYARQIVTRES